MPTLREYVQECHDRRLAKLIEVRAPTSIIESERSSRARKDKLGFAEYGDRQIKSWRAGDRELPWRMVLQDIDDPFASQQIVIADLDPVETNRVGPVQETVVLIGLWRIIPIKDLTAEALCKANWP